MGVFDKKDMPPEVQRMGARRAKLAIPVVEHNMRQETLGHVADGSSRESSTDVERWIEEECSYVEDAIGAAAVDLQTLETLHDEGVLSDDDYDDLERWVSDDVEQVYRDYANLQDYVTEIDKHFDTEHIRRVKAVFETEQKREPIPQAEMDEVMARYANFGDREL